MRTPECRGRMASPATGIALVLLALLPGTAAAAELSSGGATHASPATGQPFYTVFRSGSPRVFGEAQILAVVPAGGGATETFIDYGADVDGASYFYRVE